MISKSNKAVIEANKKGYRVINGAIFYKEREVKVIVKNTGYYGFTIRIESGERRTVMVHRLVAYEKFGKKMFKNGIQVRHLDSNCLNNKEWNIGIGSPSDNNLDKDPIVRHRIAMIATSFVKKHDHEEILRLHIEGLSYKKIMERLNIKSKGAISFIINKSMESKNKK